MAAPGVTVPHIIALDRAFERSSMLADRPSEGSAGGIGTVAESLQEAGVTLARAGTFLNG